MTSGKILWLCEKHRSENDKITIFNEEGDDYVSTDSYHKDNFSVDSLAKAGKESKKTEKVENKLEKDISASKLYNYTVTAPATAPALVNAPGGILM